MKVFNSQKYRVGQKTIFQASVSILGVFVTALFFVWTRYHAIRLGYELSYYAKQEKVLLEENRAIQLEMTYLKSIEQVEKKAIHQQGLVRLNRDQIVSLNP